MNLEGKISSFGGSSDSGMRYSEGLSLYEHIEADLRPDLFVPRGTDHIEGSCQRLRTTSYYIALRFNKEINRSLHQHSMWKVLNPKTGQWVVASLVDWGPNENTGRVVDASPAVLQALRLQTDDTVIIEKL